MFCSVLFLFLILNYTSDSVVLAACNMSSSSNIIDVLKTEDGGAHLVKRIDDLCTKLEHMLKTLSGVKENASEIEVNSKNSQYLDRYSVLWIRSEKWKVCRKNFISQLKDLLKDLNKYSKRVTFVRCVLASLGSGCLLTAYFSPKWVALAGQMAGLVGFFGLYIALHELEKSKEVLNYIDEKVADDLKLLKKVGLWFEESNEVDVNFLATSDEIYSRVLKKMSTATVEQLECKDAIKKILGETFADNLPNTPDKSQQAYKLLCNSEVPLYWSKKFLLRKYPINMEYNKISIESRHLQIFLQAFLNIPLEEYLGTMEILGKLLLNVYQLYESLKALYKGARSMYSSDIEEIGENLEKELFRVKKIIQDMEPVGWTDSPQYEKVNAIFN